MRHWVLWVPALLAMPGIAVADTAAGLVAEPMVPADGPGIERAEPSAAAPGLDLHLEPTELPAQNPPRGPRAIAPNRANGDTAADRPVTDRGLSFGVEVTPRGPANDLARVSEADEPGVQDNLERLIGRSTLGLRGRYRF